MTALAVTAEDDRGFELMTRLRALHQAETRQKDAVETATKCLAAVQGERAEVERLLAEHIGFVKPAPKATITRNRKSPATDAILKFLGERKSATLAQVASGVKIDSNSVSSLLCVAIAAGKAVRIGRGIYQAVG